LERAHHEVYGGQMQEETPKQKTMKAPKGALVRT